MSKRLETAPLLQEQSARGTCELYICINASGSKAPLVGSTDRSHAVLGARSLYRSMLGFVSLKHDRTFMLTIWDNLKRLVTVAVVLNVHDGRYLKRS